MLKLASGAGSSQLLIVVVMPLFTRLFAPQAFGELALFTAVYTLVVGVTTLKLEQALVLPAERDEAVAVARLAIILACVGAAALLLGLALVDIVRDLPIIFYLLPVAIGLGAVLSLGQQWCVREQRFGTLAHNGFINALANVVGSLVLWWMGLPSALIVAYVFSLALAALHVWSRNGLGLRCVLAAPGRLLPLVSRYRQFPTHVLPASLATLAGSQLMPILMTQLAGVHAAGLYAVANRFLALPTILLGNAVQSVFHSEYNARLNRGENTAAFFDKVLVGLLALAVPVFSIVWLVAPPLFALVFGDEYREAGDFARWLCPGIAAMFVSIPLHPVFIALRRTRLGLMLQIVASFVPIVLFAVVAIMADMQVALMAWSAGAVATAATVLLVAWRLSSVEGRPCPQA